MRKGFWLIWHATIWVLWKYRNDQIFNDKVAVDLEIFWITKINND